MPLIYQNPMPIKNIGDPFVLRAPDGTYYCYATIDGHVLFDDEGRKYFYYSRDGSENVVDGRHESHLYVAELNDDLISFRSDPDLACPVPLILVQI